jgi:hypothetical protein
MRWEEKSSRLDSSTDGPAPAGYEPSSAYPLQTVGGLGAAVVKTLFAIVNQERIEREPCS